MNSPAKSASSRSAPETSWSEALIRLHCLQALFPDWTNKDPFLLRQIQQSIEERIASEPEMENSFATFASMAMDLRNQAPHPETESHALIELDLSGQQWDPLFVRAELVRQLKLHAGTDHIFLLIRHLRSALFPHARYRTRQREACCAEAVSCIDDLARAWSTRSSRIHLLYL